MTTGITLNVESTPVTIVTTASGATISNTTEEVNISSTNEEVSLVVQPQEVVVLSANSIQTQVVSDVSVEILTVAEQGPPGVDATGQRSFAFAWGDATPATLMTVSAGQMILGVTVSIDEPFNGVGASLSVGDAGDNGSLMDANMIEPTVIGAFQNAPCLRFGVDTQIRLTITPGTGASAGSGVVSLFLE